MARQVHLSPVMPAPLRKLPLYVLLLPLVFAAGGCMSEGSFDPVAALAQRSEVRAHLDLLEDGTDLRPEAKRILEAAHLGGWRAVRDLALEESAIVPFNSIPLPTTIRVWRRSQCSTGSCSCPVDVLPLEDYVKGVVPHEWISSWDIKSLEAGAIAVRTYAAAWVSKGGKYDCADVCDTTYTQVYKDDRVDKGNQAVDATRGMVAVESGQLVFAEYSAENSDPTAFGVSDPPCAGKALLGHGRGMCQWGSKRWAEQGKDPTWIAMHYYPGSTVQGGSVQPPPPTCSPTGPEICGDGLDNDCQNGVDDGCSGGCVPTGPEVCDARDNNCDGRVDEGCSSTCTATGPEVCDGRDNNCDGRIDEGDPSGGAFCIVPGLSGACAGGVTRCLGGQVRCEPTSAPQAEVCNNYDDDCDGAIDNVPGGCGPSCTPRPEICNGQDDDCNGFIDEGNPQGGQACHVGGTCPVGFTACQGGIIVCLPQPQMEICDNLDNDCNGYVDDVPGGCGAAGSPSQCVPSAERCNGLDDDCDGFPDEGNPEGGGDCTVFTAKQSFGGVMICVSGQLACRVEDPGTGAFTGSVRELQGGACSASGSGLQSLPILTLTLLALMAWRRRKRAEYHRFTGI